MPKTGLIERIKQGVFLLDGAMGTQLIARGIEAGRCNDYLNIESPDIVLDIQRVGFKNIQCVIAFMEFIDIMIVIE